MLAMHSKITTPNDPVWLARWLNLKNNFHWHEETEIVYCQSGRAWVFIEDKELKISEGETVFIPSKQIHKIESLDGAVIITVLIDGDLAASVTELTPRSEKLTQKYDIVSYYETIKAEQIEKNSFYSSIIKAETLKLLVNILRFEPLGKEEISDPSEYGNYKQILSELQRDFASITFEEACSRYYYSPSHFSRLMVKLTGTSFTKYINILRISNAVDLLQNDNEISVSDVAERCGFSTLRSFNRCFKELTGYPPTEIPKNYRLFPELRKGAVLNGPTHGTSIVLL